MANSPDRNIRLGIPKAPEREQMRGPEEMQAEFTDLCVEIHGLFGPDPTNPSKMKLDRDAAEKLRKSGELDRFFRLATLFHPRLQEDDERQSLIDWGIHLRREGFGPKTQRGGGGGGFGAISLEEMAAQAEMDEKMREALNLEAIPGMGRGYAYELSNAEMAARIEERVLDTEEFPNGITGVVDHIVPNALGFGRVLAGVESLYMQVLREGHPYMTDYTRAIVDGTHLFPQIAKLMKASSDTETVFRQMGYPTNDQLSAVMTWRVPVRANVGDTEFNGTLGPIDFFKVLEADPKRRMFYLNNNPDVNQTAGDGGILSRVWRTRLLDESGQGLWMKAGVDITDSSLWLDRVQNFTTIVHRPIADNKYFGQWTIGLYGVGTSFVWSLGRDIYYSPAQAERVTYQLRAAENPGAYTAGYDKDNMQTRELNSFWKDYLSTNWRSIVPFISLQNRESVGQLSDGIADASEEFGLDTPDKIAAYFEDRHDRLPERFVRLSPSERVLDLSSDLLTDNRYSTLRGGERVLTEAGEAKLKKREKLMEKLFFNPELRPWLKPFEDAMLFGDECLIDTRYMPVSGFDSESLRKAGIPANVAEMQKDGYMLKINFGDIGICERFRDFNSSTQGWLRTTDETMALWQGMKEAGEDREFDGVSFKPVLAWMGVDFDDVQATTYTGSAALDRAMQIYGPEHFTHNFTKENSLYQWVYYLKDAKSWMNLSWNVLKAGNLAPRPMVISPKTRQRLNQIDKVMWSYAGKQAGEMQAAVAELVKGYTPLDGKVRGELIEDLMLLLINASVRHDTPHRRYKRKEGQTGDLWSTIRLTSDRAGSEFHKGERARRNVGQTLEGRLELLHKRLGFRVTREAGRDYVIGLGNHVVTLTETINAGSFPAGEQFGSREQFMRTIIHAMYDGAVDTMQKTGVVAEAFLDRAMLAFGEKRFDMDVDGEEKDIRRDSGPAY